MKLTRSRLLVIVGLLLMLGAAVDPLEGSLVILGGSALVALEAFLSRTHRYRLQVTAFVLTAIGVAALFGLSAIGGVGGHTGRSLWWLVLCAPYPVGWVMGLFGAAARLRDREEVPA